jgi:hypothetical protein
LQLWKTSRGERNFGTRIPDTKNHISGIWRPVEKKING